MLASVSADFTAKVWDIEKGSEIAAIPVADQLLQDINWDYTGSVFAPSSKDKTVRICDPRGGEVVQEIPNAHEGAKSIKLTYLGKKNKFVTLGFTRQSQRQIKLWDPANLSAPLKTEQIDQAAGVIIPYYDDDTNVLYLAGKGDGNIRYYEIVDENPLLFKLSEYRSTVAAKGIGFVPKRGLDIMKCETARALKLTQKTIEPLSFIVPRKSDAFQEDIFPPTFAGIPGCTSDEWQAGANPTCSKISLDPAGGGQTVSAEAAAPMPAMKTRTQLQGELDKANEYIATLTAALQAASIEVPPSPAP